MSHSSTAIGTRAARRSGLVLLRAASALATHTSSSSRCALDAASVILPHPQKADTGGEDAAFSDMTSSVFGVFDGVGGWSSRGVDAGAFSRSLAARTHAHLKADRDAALEAALTAGLRDVRVLGSCTACLLRIDRRRGVLSALNVGDSGWRLFRPGDGSASELRVEAASEAQCVSTQTADGEGGRERERERERERARAQLRTVSHLRCCT